jgi:hypothetical protein
MATQANRVTWNARTNQFFLDGQPAQATAYDVQVDNYYLPTPPGVIYWRRITAQPMGPKTIVITPILTSWLDARTPYAEFLEDTTQRILGIMDERKETNNFYIFLTNAQRKQIHTSVLAAGFAKVDEYKNPNTQKIISEYFYGRG